MSNVIIVPMGIHRYICAVEEWDELVDAVLDIVKRTGNLVNVVDYKWDMDLRVDEKVIPLNPNTFQGSLKDKICTMTRCMLDALKEMYSPEKSVVIEVRYHQEDFLADLDVYERWQKAVQADACGAETEEDIEILARAIMEDKEKKALYEELMNLSQIFHNV